MRSEKTHLQAEHSDGVIRLLQITDSHLFSDRAARLLGVTTHDSFCAVIDAIKAQQEPYDAVLATGDLSQDRSSESYHHFAVQAQKLQRPVFWIPGNHDSYDVMSDTLGRCGFKGFNQIVWPSWQIILLNTQDEGYPHGLLSPSQFSLLETALRSYPDKHTLVILHHHPLPVGCAWLDQHNLKNHQQFLTLLEQHPQVKSVLFGHVHQGFETEHAGVRYLASPSTCIQFTPLCEEFSLDRQPPGWRYLQLHPDGRIATQVWYLAQGSFLPDTEATGY